MPLYTDGTAGAPPSVTPAAMNPYSALLQKVQSRQMSMPVMHDYTAQATKEVDAAIAAGHNLNKMQRQQVIREYANHLSNLDAATAANRQALQGQFAQSDSQLAAKMAGRNMDTNGFTQAAANDASAEHGATTAEMLSKALQQRQALMQGQQHDLAGLDQQDATLEAQRAQKVADLAREMGSADWNRQVQQSQLSMQGQQLQNSEASNVLAALQAQIQQQAAADNHNLALMKQQEFSDQNNPYSYQNEMTFRENLRNLAKTADSLPVLANYARQYGRNLGDYYGLMGRPDLVQAASDRLANHPPFSWGEAPPNLFGGTKPSGMPDFLWALMNTPSGL